MEQSRNLLQKLPQDPHSAHGGTSCVVFWEPGETDHRSVITMKMIFSKKNLKFVNYFVHDKNRK